MKAGEHIGPYLLEERLGRGGFAEVWRARPDLEWVSESASPSERLAVLRVLAGLLKLRSDGSEGARDRRAGKLIDSLIETAQLLTGPESSVRPVAPEPVRKAHQVLLRETVDWVGGLASEGALDLALKVPFHDGYVRQLRREEDVLKRVKHANLVEQFQLEPAHEPPYLAMELVEGWSLRDALKQEPLPPLKKILATMDQLLSVLDHLHARNIVHGDVKPENILLEPDGTLRLIDLGLGRVSQAVMRDAYLSLSLASRVPLMGTLSYMAPEVRRGEPAGPRSDLYSAGIVLYEMLVGDVPSGMMMPSEAAPQRELTERFDILLKWVLHPEPARRVPSGAELRERVLITIRPRDRHQLGTGRTGKGRDGTLAFDAETLDQASPFIQGDWVGPFQLEEPLGRGGFGEVWRAKRGEGSREEVALKLAIGPHGGEALVKEADVAGLLDHELIPSVQETHFDHDPPYLAVDFIRGSSLRARLNERGPIDADEAIPLIRSLLDALRHCHERGVVHQDLKPENLLLDEQEGHLHLLDFGLASTGHLPIERPGAQLSDTLDTSDLEGGGTFEYMAPERRRGEEGGPPADVYAVGVILFEILTGELPRGLTKLTELCGARRSLEALTEQLLHPDPSSRPRPEKVIAALDKEKPRRRLLFRRRPGAKTSPHVRTALTVAAVFLLIAAVGAGLFVLTRPDPNRAADPAEHAGRDIARLDARTQDQALSLPVNELEEAIGASETELARLRPMAPSDPRFTLIEWRLRRFRSWAIARHASLELGTRADYDFGKIRAGLLPKERTEPLRLLQTDLLLRQIDRDLGRALAIDPISPKLTRWGPMRQEVQRAHSALRTRAAGVAKSHPLVTRLLQPTWSPPGTNKPKPWPPWLTPWVERCLNRVEPLAIALIVPHLRAYHLAALDDAERPRLTTLLRDRLVQARTQSQRNAKLKAQLEIARSPQTPLENADRALRVAGTFRPNGEQRHQLRVVAAGLAAKRCTTSPQRIDQAWQLLWSELDPSAAACFLEVAHQNDSHTGVTLLAAAAYALKGERERAEGVLRDLPAGHSIRRALLDRIQDYAWRRSVASAFDTAPPQLSPDAEQARKSFQELLTARLELEHSGVRLRETILTLKK